MNIWIISIENSIPKFDESIFHSYLPTDSLSRIATYRYAKNRIQSGLAETILRIKLSEQIGMPPHKIHFNVSNFGKPYLDKSFNIHFNISHSENISAIAVGEMANGIDIEKIRPLNINAYKDFFTTCEFAQIESTSPSRKLEIFYELWTLNEAYMKCLGRGLSFKAQSFSFIKSKDIIQLSSNHENAYTFASQKTRGDYILSTCIKSRHTTIKHHFMDKAAIETLLC